MYSHNICCYATVKFGGYLNLMSKSHTQNQLVEFINEEFKDEFFDGLTQMAHEFNINGETLIHRFTYEYISYIYKNVSQKKAHIMAHTGFKRNVVEKYLKIIQHEPNSQKTRANALFREFFHKLQVECLKSPEHTINKYGPYSFKSIFNQCLINDKTYTAPSVLEALIKSGRLIDMGDKVKFIKNGKAQKDKESLNNFFSNTINRYALTLIQNHNSKKETGDLLDQFINTPAIPNTGIAVAIDELNEILRKAKEDIRKKLEEHEGTNHTDSDYMIGVHMYVSQQAKKRE